jgi:hypothetical protein
MTTALAIRHHPLIDFINAPGRVNCALTMYFGLSCGKCWIKKTQSYAMLRRAVRSLHVDALSAPQNA